jgi:tRNA1Val (adenine37-N6)-methyltransferase
MSNNYFRFKQFTVNQKGPVFRIGTDGVILGASAGVTGKKRILDIGTGTGLIALMLAQRCDALITAIEPDRASFLQASENVELSRWHSRINVENTDLQTFMLHAKFFDLIVTNPPYFINSLKNPDHIKSASRHNDCLSHQDILEGADRLLEPDGDLQLILPYDEGRIFTETAAGRGYYCNSVVNIRSTPGSGIIRVILSFNREKKEPKEEFLTIEKGRRFDFTDEYISLTKDFYLNF